MTAREWLGRVRRIDAEINALLEAQREVLTRACGRPAIRDDSRVQTSRRNTPENLYAKYAEYSRLIDQRIDELYAVKREVMTAINKVEDGVLRTLLIAYYINGKTWEQVAEKMGYDLRWVMRLRNRALKAIESHI